VRDGPVERQVGDGLPAGSAHVQCDRPGSSWYSVSAGDFAYFLAFPLFTDGGMMWSDPPLMNSSGARSWS
jgi:hypothetical protein